MPATSVPQNSHLETLPAWARELSEKYYSRTIAMFVLHGNVRDAAPLRPTVGASPVSPSASSRDRDFWRLASWRRTGVRSPFCSALRPTGLSGRRRRTRRCWPPSAAQTARAGFPHAAFTKAPPGDARKG